MPGMSFRAESPFGPGWAVRALRAARSKREEEQRLALASPPSSSLPASADELRAEVREMRDALRQLLRAQGPRPDGQKPVDEPGDRETSTREIAEGEKPGEAPDLLPALHVANTTGDWSGVTGAKNQTGVRVMVSARDPNGAIAEMRFGNVRAVPVRDRNGLIASVRILPIGKT
jgi:hypothetical protein